MHWPSALLCALLVAAAGCGAFGGFESADQTTVTPAPVPTDPPQQTTAPEPPPGVTADGLDNVALLSAAHRQSLENRSYTLHERYRLNVTAENDTRVIERNETVALETRKRYRDEMVRTTSYPNGSVTTYEQSSYADGMRWYERRDDGTVEYQSGDIRFSRDKYAYRTTFYLNQYAIVDQSTTTVVQRKGTRLYHISGSGGELPTNERLETYHVELLVGTDGLVHRFAVYYETPTESVRYQFWYENIGETTADPPEWVDD